MLSREEKLTGLVMVVSHLAQIAGCYVLVRRFSGEALRAYAGWALGFILVLCVTCFVTGVSIFIADVFIMRLKVRRGEMYVPLLFRSHWLCAALRAEAMALYAIDSAIGRRQVNRFYRKRGH
jgi:hypothetical protein